MGCCFSSHSTSSAHDGDDDNNDFNNRDRQAPLRQPTNTANNSSINPSTGRIADPQTPPQPRGRRTSKTTPTTTSTSTNRLATSSTARPNHPIRAPSPLPTSPTHLSQRPPPWTRAQLERERDAFFETRVSGRREVWQGLRVVAEILRRLPPYHPTAAETGPAGAASTTADFRGDAAGDDQDGNDGLPAAQALLDALGLSSPHGRLVSGRGADRVKGGVYDERGVLYEIPAWIVRDPDDLIDDEEDGDIEHEATTEEEEREKEEWGVEDDDYEDDEDEDNPSSRSRPGGRSKKVEKGKGRARDLGELVALRVRLSDRASDFIVHVGLAQPLDVVIRAVRSHVGSSRRVRLMYLGKFLSSRQTLEEAGWVLGHVVNAMVFEADVQKEGKEGVGSGRGRRA